MPSAVQVSKEAVLIALRICYGELVDSDAIQWLDSLKCSNIAAVLDEVQSLTFGFDESLQSSVQILRQHLVHLSRATFQDQILSYMYNERHQISSRCSSAEGDPFEYPFVQQQA